MPRGTVELFEKAWNEDRPQLLVTSSHATQFNLEMPFGLGLIASHGGRFEVLGRDRRNHFAKFLSGAMFTGDPAELGAWLESENLPTLATSEEPKVWVAAGNCLIGDARRTDESMVVSAMSAGGFRQFVGYVVPTWFGRAGWGTLRLWQDSRGALSLNEAFFLNDARVIEETQRRFPGALAVDFDAEDIQSCMRSDRDFRKALGELEASGTKIEKDTLGLIHDRDVLAFWGDPAWEARFDPERLPHPLRHEWVRGEGGLELHLTARADFDGPYLLCLPERLAGVPEWSLPEGMEGVAADDFVFLRNCEMKQGDERVIRLAAQG
jgi:zinc protease